MKMLRRSFLALIASIIAFFFPGRAKAALPAPKLHTHQFGPTGRKTRICKNPGCHAFQYREEGTWKTPSQHEEEPYQVCPWPQHIEEGTFVQEHIVSTDLDQMLDHIVAYVEKTGDKDIVLADNPFARMIGYASGTGTGVIYTWQIRLTDTRKSLETMAPERVELLREFIKTSDGRHKIGQAMVSAGLAHKDATFRCNGVG